MNENSLTYSQIHSLAPFNLGHPVGPACSIQILLF